MGFRLHCFNKMQLHSIASGTHPFLLTMILERFLNENSFANDAREYRFPQKAVFVKACSAWSFLEFAIQSHTLYIHVFRYLRVNDKNNLINFHIYNRITSKMSILSM